MNLICCISIRVLAENKVALEALFAELTTLTRQEPGCIEYQLSTDREDPLHYILYERYVDEAAYKAHQDADYFDRLVKKVIPTLAASREITRGYPVQFAATAS